MRILQNLSLAMQISVLLTEASPRLDILKPVPFPVSRTRIIFPDPPPGRGGKKRPTARHPANLRPGFPKLGKDIRTMLPTKSFKDTPLFGKPEGSDEKAVQRPRPGSGSSSPKNPFLLFDLEEAADHGSVDLNRPLEDFPAIKDDFGNSVGPDFGPVIYEFEHNLQNLPNSFHHFNPPNTNKVEEPHPSISVAPSSPPPRIQRFPSRPTGVPQRPKPFSPSKPFSTSFTNFGSSGQSNRPLRNRVPQDKKSGCRQYTETICLDAENYPQ